MISSDSEEKIGVEELCVNLYESRAQGVHDGDCMCFCIGAQGLHVNDTPKMDGVFAHLSIMLGYKFS